MTKKAKTALFIIFSISVVVGLTVSIWVHEHVADRVPEPIASNPTNGEAPSIAPSSTVKTLGDVPLFELPWKRNADERVAQISMNGVNAHTLAGTGAIDIALAGTAARARVQQMATPVRAQTGIAVSPFGAAVAGNESVHPRALIPPPRDGKELDAKTLLAFYFKQICKDGPPALADWQTLAQSRPPDIAEFLNLPFGTGHFVISLCKDNAGKIWVGTEGEGLWSYDPGAALDNQWQHFSDQDGLGDNYVYALAVDQLGRVWAGHLNHGVSVFNGEKWHNYEAVAGLSRPDTLAGPLGERIFRIVVSPNDGDVWMATSFGLARYSNARDAWAYYTRTDGLPSNQAQSLAFDGQGNIYVGTQCDGIAMAAAKDSYKNWRVTNGPDSLPINPTGTGLPTNLINDLLVTKDGTVYAATVAGLAWSKDRGQTWQYTRGSDWSGKVQGLYGGSPKGWVQQAGASLTEDYTTCLAEDQQTKVWIGHRERGVECFDPSSEKVSTTALVDRYATCILPSESGLILSGYGDGLIVKFASTRVILPVVATRSLSLPVLPTGASAPKSIELRQMAVSIHDAPLEMPSSSKVLVLDDDWRTQGEWLGRYGRHTAILAAMSNPGDYVWGAGAENVDYLTSLGPAHVPGDSVRYWRHWLYTTSPGSLEIPPVYLDSRIALGLTTPEVNRRQSEWDDHGEAYSRNSSGPNLYCNVRIPRGRFRLAVYDFNKDGHNGADRYRDYEVNVWEHVGNQSLADLASVGIAHPLAHSRIKDFWGGVYKNFIVQGPLALTLEIRRNYSFNTILAGVMFDTFDERPEPYFTRSNADSTKFVSSEHRDASSAPVQQPLVDIDAEQLFAALQCHSAVSASAFDRDRVDYTLLLRYLKCQAQAGPIAQDCSRELGACFFALDEFAKWEECQRRQGLVPARDIEKALKWDHNIPSYSRRGYRTVSEYLERETVGSGIPLGANQ